MRSFESCRVSPSSGVTTPIGHGVEGTFPGLSFERQVATYLRSAPDYDLSERRFRIYTVRPFALHRELTQAEIDDIRAAEELNAAELVTRSMLAPKLH